MDGRWELKQLGVVEEEGVARDHAGVDSDRGYKNSRGHRPIGVRSVLFSIVTTTGTTNLATGGAAQ